jgi:hypothetical protein
LLGFDSIELPLLPINLGLLRRHSSLHVFFLPFARLHLITDQRSTEEPNRGADPRAHTGVTCSGADDPAQAGPANGSVNGALFPGRKRLRTTEKKHRQ